MSKAHLCGDQKVRLHWGTGSPVFTLGPSVQAESNAEDEAAAQT